MSKMQTGLQLGLECVRWGSRTQRGQPWGAGGKKVSTLTLAPLSGGTTGRPNSPLAPSRLSLVGCWRRKQHAHKAICAGKFIGER